ncbi:hypothetical protein FACS1894176_09870 [Bacteroidia bacterium]|nr:hypothetical protein FACS1894176_09870 [Bacteroidia bacterium]
MEYYLREKLTELGMEEYLPFIHFLATSEDINNIARDSMLRDAVNETMLPTLRSILTTFSQRTEEYKDSSMMAKTHGQWASPTTF